jgi:hypothetical protein
LLPAVSTVEYQRRARHKNTAEEDWICTHIEQDNEDTTSQVPW